jgi:hypothetical protein
MRDASIAARTILEAVATGGGRLAHMLLARLADGEQLRYWRLQTTVGSCSFTMDDSSPANVACLYQCARELVAERDDELSAIAQVLAG